MTALEFDARRKADSKSVLCAEDQTERAIHTLYDVAADFEKAVADADSHARAMQLWERLKVAVKLLEAVKEDRKSIRLNSSHRL